MGNAIIIFCNVFYFLHFPSLFILHWVSKHLIEEALSEIVEIFKLLLFQTNQLVYLVKFGNYRKLSG